MPTSEELAWMAGLLDGEGTICISNVGRCNGANFDQFKLRAGVCNTERALIEPFLVFGGWIQNTKTPKGKPFFRWTIAGEPAIKFLLAIREYIRSPRRKARLEIAIQFQDSTKRSAWGEGYYKMRLDYANKIKQI